MENQHESTKLKRLRWATFSIAVILGLLVIVLFTLWEMMLRDLIENSPGFPLYVGLGAVLGVPLIIFGVTSLYFTKISMCFSFALFILWACIVIFGDYPSLLLLIPFLYLVTGILNLLIWRTNSWDIVLNY